MLVLFSMHHQGPARRTIPSIAGLLAIVWVGGNTSLAPAQGQAGNQNQNLNKSVDTNQPLLRPIDPRTEGANEQAVNLRQPFKDLRLPLNFDQLYEVDPALVRAHIPPGRNPSRYMARASGGLIAVFPRTDDRRIAPGISRVAIPPGTVYLFADTAKLTGMTPGRSNTTPTQSSLLQRIEQPPIRSFASPTRDAAPGTPGSSSPVQATGRLPSASLLSRLTGPAQPEPVIAPGLDIPLPIVQRNEPGPTGPSIWMSEQMRQTRLDELLSRALRAATP